MTRLSGRPTRLSLAAVAAAVLFGPLAGGLPAAEGRLALHDREYLAHWFDAGDDDIRTVSQAGAVMHLVDTWELFRPQRDETLVDQATRYVDLHRPDGKPDLLQQIEQGALGLVVRLGPLAASLDWVSSSVSGIWTRDVRRRRTRRLHPASRLSVQGSSGRSGGALVVLLVDSSARRVKARESARHTLRRHGCCSTVQAGDRAGLEPRRRPEEGKDLMLCRSLPCRSTMPLLTLLLGAAVLRADTSALSFPSEVAIVNVHATVTKDGDPTLDGLSARDFRVSEGDTPQEVAFFAHEEVPVSYTLLVDVSGSMRERARLVFEALETFIGTMRPGDRASIVLFGTTARLVQEETGDRQALLAATDRIPGDFDEGTALYEVLYGHFWEVQAQGCRAERGPRRCALVVFSDGKDETSRRGFRAEVLDAARRTDLAVYPVAMTRHNSFLERLARETGGRVSYVDHGGDLAGAYRAIGAEVASQYTIGYVPKALPVPGAWHPVRVTVARKGVTVRHRAGYFTPARSAPGPSEASGSQAGR